MAPSTPPLPKLPTGPAVKRPVPSGPGGKRLLPPHTLGGQRHLLHGGSATLRGGIAVPAQGSVRVHRLALTFDHVGDGSGNRIWHVAPGQVVNVFLKVANTGDYPETVFVMAHNGDRSGPETVAPSRVASLRVQKHVLESELRGDWGPRFTLYQADPHSRDYNELFRDSSPRDNFFVGTDASLGSEDDLKPAAIKDLQLGMAVVGPTYGNPDVPAALPTLPWIPDHHWQGTGYAKATSLQMAIVIQNRTAKASSPRRLTIKLNGIRSYTPANLRGNAHYPARYSHTFGCSGQFCPVQKRVDVPSIEPFGQTEVQMSFSDLPFTLWVNDRGSEHGAHRTETSGYYSCSTNVGDSTGSQIAIQAEVQAGIREGAAADNGLRSTVTFGPWSGHGCGVVGPVEKQAYTPRQ